MIDSNTTNQVVEMNAYGIKDLSTYFMQVQASQASQNTGAERASKVGAKVIFT